MKKQLLFLSLAAVAGTVNAQVTITSADQPTTLQVFHNTRDTSMTAAPGNSGTGQNYNFTGLLDQSEDSMTFTLPQWTPYGSSYPQTNIAIMVNQGDAYIYGVMNSTSLEIHGQAADPFGNGIIPLTFTNPETQMIFPAAYGSSFADTAGGTNQFYLGYDPGVGFTIDSVRIRTTIHKTADFDGSGSATSPLGTFNVLRQNTYRRQLDTIDIFAFGNWAYEFFTQMDSTRTYAYWTNGIGFPIVELTDQDDLGQITEASWLKQLPTVTGIPVSETSSMVVYPNPATDAITFQTEETEGSIELMDMTGRVVKTVVINSNATRVDVTDLAAGMYTYRVIGTSVTTGQVQVTR